MSLNIFQLLKQGTSLKRQNLSNIKVLEEKIEVKKRPANIDYQKSGKFVESDSQQVSDAELQENARIKNQNRAEQKRIVLRKLHNIHVHGDSIPPLLNNFTKMIQYIVPQHSKYKLKESIILALGGLGFKEPTPVQMQVIPVLLEKRNVLATAPTGSGKTISFALPLIQNLQHKKLEIQAIILTPFFQLSQQILNEVVDLAKGTDLKISSVFHLTEKQKERLQNNKPISVDILIGTPLSFIHSFEGNQNLLSTVQYLIMDECDKYFQESFLEQIKQILAFFKDYNPTYGLFSATIQHPVEELLHTELLDDAVRVEIGGKNHVLDKIHQTLEYCSNEFGKLVQIRNIINESRFIPPVLLFVQSKERAKELFFQLRKIFRQVMGCVGRVEYITADKSKADREAIINKFQKGQIWGLIATDLISRGIDFKGVNLVINYDFPTSMLTYIHRVGRTGRAERDGNAITFYTDEDRNQLRSLGNLMKVSGCDVPEWIFELKQADKRERKHRIKHPVDRQSISLESRKHIDPNWKRELAISEKKFIKKFKKDQEAKEAQQDDDQGWQIAS